MLAWTLNYVHFGPGVSPDRDYISGTASQNKVTVEWKHISLF